MDAFTIILFAALLSTTLPVLAGSIYRRQLKPEMRILWVLLTLAMLVNFVTTYYAYQKVNVNWVHHVYEPIEYAGFGFILAGWHARAWVKKIILWSIPPFFLLCTMSLFRWHDIQQTNSFTASVACIAYIFVSAWLLVDLERRRRIVLSRDFRFWVASGLLIYATGSLTYFLFFDKVVSYVLWGIHAFIDMIANVFYAFGMICQVRWD